MWNALKVYLPKSKINRYIKREVLYGTIGSQGFGLKNLFLSQGISHIVRIVEHIWKDTVTGHFLHTNIEQLRLEIGMNIEIFNTKYDNFLLGLKIHGILLASMKLQYQLIPQNTSCSIQ